MHAAMLRAPTHPPRPQIRCPYYYSVATQLHAAMQASMTADESFPAFILNTFRGRYRVSEPCRERRGGQGGVSR